jgi:hypothetical protein
VFFKYPSRVLEFLDIDAISVINICGFFVFAVCGFIYLWFILSPLAQHIRSQRLKRQGCVATATISFYWTGTDYKPTISFVTNSGVTRQSNLPEADYDWPQSGFNYNWLPDGSEFAVIYDPDDASFMEPDSASGLRERKQAISIYLTIGSMFSFVCLLFFMGPYFAGMRINFMTLGALAGSTLALLLFWLRVSRYSEVAI